MSGLFHCSYAALKFVYDIGFEPTTRLDMTTTFNHCDSIHVFMTANTY